MSVLLMLSCLPDMVFKLPGGSDGDSCGRKKGLVLPGSFLALARKGAGSNNVI